MPDIYSKLYYSTLYYPTSTTGPNAISLASIPNMCLSEAKEAFKE
ncbi:MAG: hypothetical protein RBR63_05000 [Methanosarcina vacuolata]|nr:hypothetical protein [Methanosarcina vacuolata]